MIEIDGKKYYTKNELVDLYDSLMYVVSLKDSLIESYKGQIDILEEIIDKITQSIKGELKKENINGLL